MINTNQYALLELLKASLFSYSPAFPYNTDWDAVLKEAKDQGVASLVFNAVPQEEVTKWEGHKKRSAAYFIWVLQAQNELLKLFESNEIPLVILKGNAAALYYPNPSLRAVGDIDFLVPQNRFEESKALMDNSGYKRLHGNIDDARHIEYSKNDVFFEMHHHFSSMGLDIEPAVISGLNRVEYASLFGMKFPILPVLENGLVLLTHIRQHLLDEVFSLGLKQIIDWMMYVHANVGKDGWDDDFFDLASTYGLETLAITVTHLCQKWLGLPVVPEWVKYADEKTSNELLETVMSSGNFGVKLEKVKNPIKTTFLNVKKDGVFRYLQEAGMENWKAAQKYVILRPFAWCYQIVRYIKKSLLRVLSGKSITKEFSETTSKADFFRRLGI